jgi:sialate O-acetylesterase
VRFAGQDKQVIIAEDDARWDIRLDSIPSSTVPRELVIIGNEMVTFTDVLVGEFWLCSGQSNMQKPLGQQPGQ